MADGGGVLFPLVNVVVFSIQWYGYLDATTRAVPPLTDFPNDGFPVTAAEGWYRHKMRIVQDYLAAYVGQLAGRADDFTLVDLYAGNGLYSMGTRRERFAGSALAALGQDLPIHRYIFCEAEADQLGALKVRVNRHFRNKHVILLEGRPEHLLEKIKLYAPASRQGFASSLICLCDPFSLNPPFSVVQELAAHGFTLIVPFTFPLNAQMDFQFYLGPERHRLVTFLGREELVDRLAGQVGNNHDFYRKLVRQYELQLLALGYTCGLSTHKVDSGLMDLPVYHIALFSKELPARSVTHLVQAGSATQLSMFG
ncbi:MAG: three-Cys-motif partner protein TcmP [Cyclobacteriaceae bacterium]|nr:three-Cys-motif partner protein TcmP [Cyclobacteriaceae bacterium]